MNQAFLISDRFAGAQIPLLSFGRGCKNVALRSCAGRGAYFFGLPALRQDVISLFLHTSRGKVPFWVPFVSLGVTSMTAALKRHALNGQVCVEHIVS